MNHTKKQKDIDRRARETYAHIRRMKEMTNYDYAKVKPAWEHQLESLRQMQGKRG